MTAFRCCLGHRVRTILTTASALAVSVLGGGGLGRRRRCCAAGEQTKRADHGRAGDGRRACPILAERRAARFGYWTQSTGRAGPGVAVAELADWFLTAEERGNPATRTFPPGARAAGPSRWSTARATSTSWSPRSRRSTPGDYVFFTDWRGDPDQKVRDEGPTIAELFCTAAERGVVVKGLMWRSHLDKFAYSEEENRHLGEAIERAGGEVLLDQRVRFGGSHHQKLVVIRHPGAPERDVAFAGGIDLCHSRRDDEHHLGDPQAVQMSRAVRRPSAVARRPAAAAGPGRRRAGHHVP